MDESKEIVKQLPLNLLQCFTCSGWTPVNAMREVGLEGKLEHVCVACYRQLMKRAKALEIESRKLKEEEDYEEEAKAAFEGSQTEES